ncbi:MAG: hypothetical protein R2788_22715 [Saprospiraceae bacterium]
MIEYYSPNTNKPLHLATSGAFTGVVLQLKFLKAVGYGGSRCESSTTRASPFAETCSQGRVQEAQHQESTREKERPLCWRLLCFV